MEAATLAPKPDHVPDHLYVNYDAVLDSDNDPSLRMPETVSRLFDEHGPLFWTPRDGGYWMVGDYQAVYDMARDPETFANDPRIIPALKDVQGAIPVNLDGADHAAFRAPLVSALTPATINAMEKGIRELAAKLSADLLAKGKGDAVTAFAEPLPVIVFLKLLGLPVERAAEFRDLVALIFETPDPQQREAVVDRVKEVCAVTVNERRVKREDDLISKLLDTRIYDREITHDEMLSYCFQLFAAGLDTVVNTLGFGIYHLAQDQALQSRLRADPSLIPDAVEELVRRYAIVQNWRFVTRDCEFYGVQLKKYDRLLYCSPRANIDPKVFDDPLTVDIEREGETHMGFFVGPHRCVGSHLARLEMRVGYEEFLRHIPQFHLDPDRRVTSKRGFTYGLQEVPLVW